MSQFNLHNIQNNTVGSWIQSNRVYENTLFYHILIVAFWFFIGFITLGFEFSSLTTKDNLFLNFLWFLFLSTCMAFTPLWYKLLFANSKTEKQIKQIEATVLAITDYINRNGEHRIKPLQCTALIFLGAYCLFEIFYISAWVKDWTLVWEPAWVKSVVEWVIANTNTPPLNVDRKFFQLDITEEEFNGLSYENEEMFINSESGTVVLFYRFIRSLSSVFIMTSLIVIFWRMLDWLGMQRIDPRYIHNKHQFLWVSFLTFFMWLILFGGYFFLFGTIDILVPYSMGKYVWLSLFWQNIVYIFVLFSIKMIVGWLFFWKYFLTNLIED